MKIDRVIQLATLIAVVVGLALVVWELQQVRTLTRAQLSSDFVDTLIAVNQMPVGESLSSALAKACLSPNELSLDEMIEIDRYYFAILNLVNRVYLLSDRDGIYPDQYWRSQLGFLTPIFSSPYGRIWFSDRQSTEYGEGIVEAAREYMATIEPDACEQRYLRRIRAGDDDA